MTGTILPPALLVVLAGLAEQGARVLLALPGEQLGQGERAWKCHLHLPLD